MSGIYIHIPFCKSRCCYCDFYSTTALHCREPYVEALIGELQLRHDYLNTINQPINTIYFGGGTPSLLKTQHIQLLLDNIRATFDLSPNAEITIEANPSDLTDSYLSELLRIGVNRLSMGVQSFSDPLLSLLGRRHTSQQAIEAVMTARHVGFENISIDLIYGIPNQTLQAWQSDVEQAIQLPVEHISTYCLTYEDGTRLTQMLHSHTFEAIDDDTENEMYDLLVSTLQTAGFYRYEVSNFAKQGYESRHNSSYWYGVPYLGLGAAAHSFDGQSRQWNISDLRQYMNGVKARNLILEKETLTEKDKYNEAIMTQLRTSTGIDLSGLNDSQKDYCLRKSQVLIEQGLLSHNKNHLIATQRGIHLLNRIILELMQ